MTPGRQVDRECVLARVVRGVPPSSARDVAELFYVSFGLKLAGLVLPRDHEAGIELLTALFCLDEVYAALDGSGRVLGVAFVTGHDRVLCLSRDALTVAYGPVRWRMALRRLPHPDRPTSRLPAETPGGSRASRWIRRAAGGVSVPR